MSNVPSNQIFQRQDFQNRRSSSEPVQDQQTQNRFVNPSSSKEQNRNDRPNHHVHVDGGFVDCLQKVRFSNNKKTTKNCIHKNQSILR